ncbi:hypothetical protein [Rubrobacter aplysinae]|uniref:hypothetical protein n=1 Tax=Rubrobacter aplysinae TaxID=909625 RepID=UPI00064BBA3B|nr:hypothetical protein [Rubrobacter aplysinae]
MRPEIEPAPTPEEAVAIVAAIESLRGGGGALGAPEQTRRSRWEVAGRLGRPLPGDMRIEGSLWPLLDTANWGRAL